MKINWDKMNDTIIEFIDDGGEHIAYYKSRENLNIAYYKVWEVIGEQQYCEFTYNAPQSNTLYDSFNIIYQYCKEELDKRKGNITILSVNIMSIFGELTQCVTVDITPNDAFSFVEKMLFEKGYYWRSGSGGMLDILNNFDNTLHINIRKDNKIGWSSYPHNRKACTLSELLAFPSIKVDKPLLSIFYDRAAQCARLFEQDSSKILEIISLSDVVYLDDVMIKNLHCSSTKKLKQSVVDLTKIKAKKIHHVVHSEGYLYTYIFHNDNHVVHSEGYLYTYIFHNDNDEAMVQL